jgi:Protein of unknown function (DUF3574)
MIILRLAVAAFFACQVTGAAAQLSCTVPQKPMLDVELLLGRGKASDARWRDFLAREVMPRFPDGLTVYETTGQWRDPTRSVVTRERSRVLRLIVPAEAPRDKIEAVASSYKKQFAQKSVGIVMRPACVSF